MQSRDNKDYFSNKSVKFNRNFADFFIGKNETTFADADSCNLCRRDNN